MDNQEDKSSSPVLHHTEQSEKQAITTTSQQTDHGAVDSNEQNPTTSSPPSPRTEAAAAVESETTRAVAAADETPAASPPLDDNAATALVDLAETLKEESPAVVATGSSIGARNVYGRKVGSVKTLMGPPPETAGRSSGARNGDGTAGLIKSLTGPPETAERSKGWVLALPAAAAEHKSASTSWNRKEPHRALAANPENSPKMLAAAAAAATTSKKRKQVIKNTGHEEKSEAAGTAASPPRNISYGCSYCMKAWFLSRQLLAEHIRDCPMKKP